jgi:hypothetical protein
MRYIKNTTNKWQCDLQQPECGQCIERGTLCGGYDTDRVFVYHNAGNKPLVGCKPHIKHSTQSPDVEVASFTQVQAFRDYIQVVPDGFIQSQSPYSPPTLPFVLPISLAQTAYGEKSIEAFMRMYIPLGDMRSTNAEGRDFVDITSRLRNHDEALRLALLAIGTVALGKQTDDTNLTRHGRNLYGKALFETRRALQNPSRARTTAILAIPHVSTPRRE